MIYPTPEQYKALVRQRLKELKLTQREVCDEIGVPHAMLSQWLAPEKDILLTTVNKIENAITALSQEESNAEGTDDREDSGSDSGDRVSAAALANLL